MDNGQVQQNSQNRGSFFTSGQGIDIEKENNLISPDENLNSDTNWSNQTERNIREIGSNVLNSSGNERMKNQLPIPEKAPNDQELGEVVDLNMPPHEETLVEEDANQKTKEKTEDDDPIQYENIRTKESLNSEGVKAVNVIKNGLEHKDTAKSYSMLQKARKANVEHFDSGGA